jgi:PST family polysaccharide transporter
MVDIWGRQALNFVVFVVLARLLTPIDFGLVALAGVFVAFAQVLVDQGLGDALIQRREVTRRMIDTAFWVALATGSLLTLAGIVLAIPIAALLGEPALQPILQVLALTLVLAAPASIQIALMRRELEFRSLAIRGIVAAAGGGLVGVAMAVLGAGAWALVGQQVGAAVLSVVTLWRVSPWRAGREFSRTDFVGLFRFGANVVGSDVLNFLSRNTDNLLIGVVLGPIALGFYAVAYRVLDVSQTVLINVARKIAFPAFARLQHDRERLLVAYFRVVRAASAAILPGYVGMALVAPEMMVVVFGRQWADSGPVAAILFLIGPVLSVMAFSDSLLMAAGHPEIVFRFRLITAATNIGGFLFAVQFGIVAVAAAFVIRGYLLLPLNLLWMRRYAAVPPTAYVPQLRGSVIAVVAMAAVVLGLKAALSGPLHVAGLLAVEVAGGAATYLGVLWLVERSLVRDLVHVAEQAVPIVSRLVRRR